MDEMTKSIVESLKKEGHSVFAVTVGGKKYIYRSVSRKEFRTLRDTMARKNDALKKEVGENSELLEEKLETLKEEGEEDLVLLALVSPEIGSTEDMPAGFFSTMSDLILQASGFGVEAEPELL